MVYLSLMFYISSGLIRKIFPFFNVFCHRQSWNCCCHLMKIWMKKRMKIRLIRNKKIHQMKNCSCKKMIRLMKNYYGKKMIRPIRKMIRPISKVYKNCCCYVKELSMMMICLKMKKSNCLMVLKWMSWYFLILQYRKCCFQNSGCYYMKGLS
jgi:hypothetical protein